MATLGSIIISCQNLTGESSGTVRDMFKEWINEGQQDIATRYLWPFLEKSTPGAITTAADDDTYSLASDVAVLYDLYDTTNYRKLRYITNADFDKLYPNPSATGAPYLYRLLGESETLKQVVLYPIPAGAYTLRYKYYKRLSDLSEPDEESGIPSQYHRLLKWYALKMFWLKEGDSRYTTADREYENGLVSMVEELGGAPVDHFTILESVADLRDGPPVPQLPSTFERYNW